jgi:hypothetical protein
MDPNQTINLNQNAAQCIHSADHFGNTIYYNICTHTEMNVPWGGADWALWILGYGALVGLVLALIIGIITFIYVCATD